MHRHDLGYDPADAPIPAVMVRVLKETVESTSLSFVAKHGPLTKLEIRLLLKGHSIHDHLLRDLRHWYMIERPRLPEYKQQKNSVTKTGVNKAAGVIRKHFAKQHQINGANVRIEVSIQIPHYDFREEL